MRTSFKNIMAATATGLAAVLLSGCIPSDVSVGVSGGYGDYYDPYWGVSATYPLYSPIYNGWSGPIYNGPFFGSGYQPLAPRPSSGPAIVPPSRPPEHRPVPLPDFTGSNPGPVISGSGIGNVGSGGGGNLAPVPGGRPGSGR